jgi:hypothetical protein
MKHQAGGQIFGCDIDVLDQEVGREWEWRANNAFLYGSAFTGDENLSISS